MANRDLLRSVPLPASLVSIDGSAFAGCPKLEKVTVHPVEPPVCGSDNVFASEIFPVAPGIYVVRAGSESQRVMVR